VRHRTQWLEDVGIIVVDEVHLVNDSKRGPTLEMVIAKMMQSLPNLQIVALSATISNSDRIAEWLNAELVTSTWRPVPLREGIYFDNKISFILDGRSKSIPRRRPEIVSDVVCDILDEKGQALVFVSSRRSTVAVAKKIASSVRPYLSVDAQELLTKAAKKLSKRPSAPEATKTLARVIASGVAFHHAGLDNNERTLVEDFFKDDMLKVVIATPTLAAGVNLPARRVVIRDYRRFEQGRGSYTIPVLEYKQMAGRAGRPKYDSYGEAILIAKSELERDALTDEYVLAEPERITSKLASPSALRSHLLASIATDMTRNREEVDSLIKGTFFSCQFDPLEIQHHVSSALIFLQDGQLIESTESGAYSATPLGRRASRLYIDPYTAILLRDALSETKEVTPIGALHLICHTPDQQVTYLTRTDFDEYDSFVEEHKNDFMIEPPIDEIEDYGRYLAEVKTARLLEEWISESSDREITEGFNVGMGDVHRYVQTAEWLVYSASEIARVVNATQHIPFFYSLRSRLKYGVQRELLDLVTLRGIGRIRGRMLYANGMTNQSDLYHASLEEIARVPTIGTSLAKSIKRQLGVDVPVTEGETTSLEPEDDEDTYSIQTLLEDFEIEND
jgi:helicase